MIGGSGVVPRHVGAASTALGAGGVGPMSAVMLTVTNVDVEKGILTEVRFRGKGGRMPRLLPVAFDTQRGLLCGLML